MIPWAVFKSHDNIVHAFIDAGAKPRSECHPGSPDVQSERIDGGSRYEGKRCWNRGADTVQLIGKGTFMICEVLRKIFINICWFTRYCSINLLNHATLFFHSFRQLGICSISREPIGKPYGYGQFLNTHQLVYVIPKIWPTPPFRAAFFYLCILL
jgi:hypothetical protein